MMKLKSVTLSDQGLLVLELLSQLINLTTVRRSDLAESHQADSLKQTSLDLKISRLQELKEKERVYKDSYTLVDDLVLCLRCLLD